MLKEPTAARSLRAQALSVALAGRRRPVLDALELELAPGRVHGLLGSSGSGKTTLLHSLNGLVPWQTPAAVSGSVLLGGEAVDDLDPAQRAHLLGSCLDRPEAQLFLATPRQELEAARRLYGEAPLTGELVARLGLGRLLDRRVLELSSGERQRVALACALAAAPRPVLLDEPTAHLDSEGASALADSLAAAAGSGAAVLAAEQAGWRLGCGVGAWYGLADGRLRRRAAPSPLPLPAPEHPAGGTVVLEARGVMAEVAGRPLFAAVELALHEGEVVLLSGANGVGKSSLARVLCGVARPFRGSVSCRGPAPAMMLPEARLQLFSATVLGELERGNGTGGELARVLRRHRLEALAARAPWTLSRGERQRLVHAALDLLRPPVLVVDEPAQGLDPEDLAAFVGLVHRRAARGRCYLLISHREELAAAAHRHLRLTVDGLEEVAR